MRNPQGGGGLGKTNIQGELPENGGLAICRFKGDLAKGVVFLRGGEGVDTPMHVYEIPSNTNVFCCENFSELSETAMY